MTFIKLSPAGRKGDKIYKVTVSKKGAKLTGSFIEKLGIYRPGAAKPVFELNTARYQYWLSVGAQPSARLKTVVKQFKDKLTWGEAPVVATPAPKAAKAKAPKAAAPKAAKPAPKAAAAAKKPAAKASK